MTSLWSWMFCADDSPLTRPSLPPSKDIGHTGSDHYTHTVPGSFGGGSESGDDASKTLVVSTFRFEGFAHKFPLRAFIDTLAEGLNVNTSELRVMTLGEGVAVAVKVEVSLANRIVEANDEGRLQEILQTFDFSSLEIEFPSATYRSFMPVQGQGSLPGARPMSSRVNKAHKRASSDNTHSMMPSMAAESGIPSTPPKGRSWTGRITRRSRPNLNMSAVDGGAAGAGGVGEDSEAGEAADAFDEWQVAGMSLEQAQQGKRVVNVYQSSTAFLAGCRIGDLVLRVEGQDAAKMSQGEIIAMIDRQLRG
mmetsp:Transcript_97964/g.280246  ORF Transcript_97964/g.280246 Transcript_97964/m.280246 type:complete len:307 (+) Transcript_97964:296-1216(+)